jgi:hypothetical protein
MDGPGFESGGGDGGGGIGFSNLQNTKDKALGVLWI